MGKVLRPTILVPADVAQCPLRKANSHRPVPLWERFLRASQRKVVETVGRLITRRFPTALHAVTQQGFELKVVYIRSRSQPDCPIRSQLELATETWVVEGCEQGGTSGGAGG